MVQPVSKELIPAPVHANLPHHMSHFLQTVSAAALREAAELKDQIEELTSKLGRILDGTGSQSKGKKAKTRSGRFSVETLAKMRAAQRARWAKIESVATEITKAPKRRKRRKMSPEARAKIAEAQRRRWAARKKASTR